MKVIRYIGGFRRDAESTPLPAVGLPGLVLVVLALTLLTGCTSRALVEINREGPGSAEIVVDLDPVFVSYFRDLAGSVGADSEAPIFDVGAINRRFSEEESLTLSGVAVPAQGRLELTLAFAELSALASDERIGRLLSWEPDGAGGTLTMTITPAEIPYLLSLVGIGEDSPVAYLLPPPEGEMSSDEYAEYLSWALEEYAPPGRLEALLQAAAVTVTVRAPGPIDAILNGEALGSTEAQFRLPLLALLTGETPGVYRLSY